MDSIETASIPESERLGRASFYLMDGMLGWLLDAGVGAVYEQNFRRGVSEVELRKHLPRCRAVLLHLQLPRELSIERYVARFERGERHPGHHDGARIGQIRAGVRPVRWDHYEQPLDLDVRTLRVDTTDGYRPGFEEIVAFARSAQAK